MWISHIDGAIWRVIERYGAHAVWRSDDYNKSELPVYACGTERPSIYAKTLEEARRWAKQD
jgi:hypothetical protein